MTIEVGPILSSGALYQQEETATSHRELNTGLKLLLGALVPGLPQFLDGKVRAWGYFAAEATSIAGLIAGTVSGNNFKDQYKILAVTARDNFVYPGFRDNTTEPLDVLRPGYGEYYEDLLKWPSSGDYDDDPSQTGLQPESDPRTYNGHQWDIARINNYSETSGGLPIPASQAEEQAALE
ncbi:MAG TPA: hypothetical protein VJ417_14045, partial [Candidatus Glassbacteria bacterium]|nr:hypothetical protein [Candidatus Glassbacteria bacterium]